MSFCLAYPQNGSWGEIRFLSPKLASENLEAADQEDQVIGFPLSVRGIVSYSLANIGHQGIHPAKDAASFPFQPFSSEQKISILRC